MRIHSKLGTKFTALSAMAFVALGSAWLIVRAEPPARSSTKNEVTSRTATHPNTALSEFAPGLLADFIRDFGQDRPASDASKLTQSGLSVGGWAVKVLNSVTPRGYFGMKAPVSFSTSSGKSREESPAKDMLLIAGTNVQLTNGQIVPQGEPLPLGSGCPRGARCDTVNVANGFILNGSETHVPTTDPSGRIEDLGSGEAVYVATVGEWAENPDAQSGEGGVATTTCTANCRDGYYGCCNQGGWFSSQSCKCIANNVSTGCQSGGPGTASCSLSAD